MLGIVQHLRQRYHDARFSKMAAPRDIVAEDGTSIGYIDSVGFEDGRLRVQGWVQNTQRVTVQIAGLTRSVAPAIARNDVSQMLGVAGQLGFDLSVVLTTDQFCEAGFAVVSFEPNKTDSVIPPLDIDFGDMRKDGLAADLSFVLATIKVLPACARWVLRRSPQDRARVLDGLGLSAIAATTQINANIFAPAALSQTRPADQDPTRHRITILLPVFNAFDVLPEVLSRVLTHTDVPFHLVVIEDCSSDINVRPFLQQWTQDAATKASVTLVENTENLGFIGSINAGLDLAMGTTLPDLPKDCVEGPIVLLNSDALVPANWASRLIAPMLADHKLASTTPMSNDAEIMSVPVLCKPSPLGAGVLDQLDAAAARLNGDVVQAVVPTGVGFCMAMSRSWVRKLPRLDPVFGRGYGEEVDWCQRARALGARHAAIGNLFVEHRGGSSFGSADKQAMIAKNNAIVSARYPTYDADVQGFISTDPLLSARLSLALAWAGISATAAVPVYLAHSLGGGADQYVQTRIKDDLQNIGAAIVLRVGGVRTWRIEVHTPHGITLADTDDTDLMVRLFDQIEACHIIYSCGVGAPDPASLPAVLLRLFDREKDRLTVLVHDFFMISPSYTLLGSDGAYRGPILDRSTDPAHSFRGQDGKIAHGPAWQAQWHKLLKQADAIEVFSDSSAIVLLTLWPDLSKTIQVTPHTLPHTVDPVSPPSGTQPKALGVLGGINFAKGASVVEQLAKDRPDLSVVIIGKVDPTYSMPPNVKVHGSYTPQDIADLARRYRIAQWLIPSIWPETFSYTTHEALATGLPVLAFGIGAQGDAVAKASNGVVLPFDTDADAPTRNLAKSVLDHLSIS